MMTSAPSAARANAVARPRPREPPVIRAVGEELVMTITFPRRGAARKRPREPRIGDPWLTPRAPSHTGVMDREQLADFLRHRREGLQPEDVGLARGARRRTNGLRRE